MLLLKAGHKDFIKMKFVVLLLLISIGYIQSTEILPSDLESVYLNGLLDEIEKRTNVTIAIFEPHFKNDTQIYEENLAEILHGLQNEVKCVINEVKTTPNFVNTLIKAEVLFDQIAVTHGDVTRQMKRKENILNVLRKLKKCLLQATQPTNREPNSLIANRITAAVKQLALSTKYVVDFGKKLEEILIICSSHGKTLDLTFKFCDNMLKETPSYKVFC